MSVEGWDIGTLGEATRSFVASLADGSMTRNRVEATTENGERVAAVVVELPDGGYFGAAIVHIVGDTLDVSACSDWHNAFPPPPSAVVVPYRSTGDAKLMVWMRRDDADLPIVRANFEDASVDAKLLQFNIGTHGVPAPRRLQ